MCFSAVQSRTPQRILYEVSNCVNFSKKYPSQKLIEIIRKTFIDMRFQLILKEEQCKEHRLRRLETLNYFAVLYVLHSLFYLILFYLIVRLKMQCATL